jgi:hypothetical protein
VSGSDVEDALRRLGRLPEWLMDGADPDRIAAAPAVRELTSGGSRLVQCDPKLRLKEDGAWAASYRLVVSDDGGAERLVELVGSFRPGEAPTLLPREADEGLPALDDLTDPTRARDLLEGMLQQHWPGVSVASCTPEVMRYKPGSRCTVRYQLAYDGEGGPSTVIAKTYRGSKGANAYRGMTLLDGAGIPAETVMLAPALGYRADLKVLVQGAVPEETTLKAVAFEAGADGDFDRLRTGVERAAAGLAALHHCGIDHGEEVTWDDEAADVDALVARLERAAPEITGAVTPYLDSLRALAAASVPDPVGPAHRSFRPAQVLLAGDRISFIDFDGLCTAEPAIDVALFRASLRDATLRTAPPDAIAHRIDGVDAVCEHFLASYEAHAPVSRSRVAMWEGLYLLISVLHCWTKVRPARLGPLMQMLTTHLETLEREFSAPSGSR